MSLSRRRLLVALSAAAGGAVAWRSTGPARQRAAIGGRIVGAAHATGHKLRDAASRKPDAERRTGVVIVGAGVSGLTAAWKLLRSGYTDFTVLDLEPRAGGTASWGDSPVTAYPWGAHYLPLPTPELGSLCALLTELGVIESRAADGSLNFSDSALCFAPQERLYLHGRWQEGLFPTLGATKRDLEQYRAFQKLMAGFRVRRDATGRHAFALPVERSARDPELLALDRISMREFLKQHGFDSKRLAWYVEYGCRDDYGCDLASTSAWAGVHYHACRPADEAGHVLTWPEGNGWIARRLAGFQEGRIATEQLAVRVSPETGGVAVDALDAASGRVTRHRAAAAILACPKFVTTRILEGYRPGGHTYAPWVVANLTVDRVPEGPGVAPAWDNVLYDTPSLGYIVATHQHRNAHPVGSMLTYYRPFTGDPVAERARMLATPWTDWRDQILAELARAHPDIDQRVKNVDVMLWGHAMVRPTPGFLWGGERERALAAVPRVHHAHCDASGLPLFEEAFYRGLAAAEGALADLGRPFTRST